MKLNEMKRIAEAFNVLVASQAEDKLNGAWFEATFDPPRVLRLIAVAEAARERNGERNYCEDRCASQRIRPRPCNCGAVKLAATLAALEAD